jgi:hypothetical protein
MIALTPTPATDDRRREHSIPLRFSSYGGQETHGGERRVQQPGARLEGTEEDMLNQLNEKTRERADGSRMNGAYRDDIVLRPRFRLWHRLRLQKGRE